MTIATDRPLKTPRAGAWIGRAFAWWLGELRGIFDDFVVRSARDGRHAITIEAGERYWIVRRRNGPIGQIDRGDSQELAGGSERLRALVGATRADRAVIVEIPPERALSKTISLPVVARSRIDQVLRFEIARHFPFPAERVLFRYRVLDRAGAEGALAIEIVAVPRDVVTAIRDELADAGLRVRGVALVAEDTGERFFVRASALGEGGGSARPALVSRTLVGAVTVLAVAAAVSWPFAQRARLAAADREIAALKPRADSVLHRREEQQRIAARYAAILRLKGGGPPLVAVLDRLSRDLPDGSWLLSLSISGRDVVIDGLAPSAAAIALALEHGKTFHDITFRSPISREPSSGLEHFQLGMTIAEQPR